MREIKFRGWSGFYEKWVYGYYYVDSVLGFHFINNGNDFRVDPKSVGQYTGLKNSKDVEIYEGDIIGSTVIHSTIADAVIVFNNGKFQGVQLTHERYRDDACYIISHRIIGNIYENPELIEELEK